MALNLSKDRVIAEILSAIKTDDRTVRIAGTWGSYAHLLTATISRHIDRPVLYLCPHIDDADKLNDDAVTFGAKQALTLNAWEGEEEFADATDEIRAERMRVSLHVTNRKNPAGLIIACSVQALMQPVAKIPDIQAGLLELETNKDVPPQAVASWLVDNGFERVDRVDVPGQFAARGGIVDIFAPVLSSILDDNGKLLEKDSGGQAIRIEFFADTVESIRCIDLDTHRSTNQLNKVSIVSAKFGTSQAQQEMFLNLLDDNWVVMIDEPGNVQDVAQVYRDRTEKPERLYRWQDIYQELVKFKRIQIERFGSTVAEDLIQTDVRSVQKYQHSQTMWSGHKQALGELIVQAKNGTKVIMYCEAAAEVTRMTEIIEKSFGNIPKTFELVHGFIHNGFYLKSSNTIVISHHELFGQFTLKRRQRPIRASLPIDTLSDLAVGDYVVHTNYGIGKFLGVKSIENNTGISEYLSIQYADGVKVQVSVNNITLVQKYIGTSPRRPELSKVGSKKWKKQKDKVTRSVQSLAAELLQVQAKRRTMGGITYPEDTAWQKEFEQSFLYEETADQITVIRQIKDDMQKNIAMDRLLCGDVGYGKTELAMRAAFKAVESGKQTAVLVPTTVLCVQHGRTFAERFSDFPVTIEILNRFKTSKQAKNIIDRTKQGKVDILIGTHRLLSGDLDFKNLGLLIIDEEQRFGVSHKEKLKKIRYNVDILTMTATPIPRTLHMSLLGLRDISSLQTPPLDRRAVATAVTRYNPESLRKAIIRELNRQGQVFFLHNRVKTIDRKTWELKKLLEETGARIDIAHGQMSKRQLENAMIKFVNGQTDVLVCTTIIESGLDIPNANTIFIDDADRFGLAELHQLRGRVGRYKHRAYAYMLLPQNRSINPAAAKRLKAIEEYSHLGAGFRIALRDLEIRGAGNILGVEQSGHIQIVGYQMYCELLAEAVRKLSGKADKTKAPAMIDIGAETYIPKSYISSDRHRMDAYRKIAMAGTQEDIQQTQAELRDVYGELPEQVSDLLEIARLRVAAAKHGIKAIVVSGQNIVLTMHKTAIKQTNKLLADVKGKATIADEQTVYLRLNKSYFEKTTIINLLRKILQKNT